MLKRPISGREKTGTKWRTAGLLSGGLRASLHHMCKTYKNIPAVGAFVFRISSNDF